MRGLLAICCAAAVLLLGSTEGYAFDAEDLEKLKSTGSCSHCDLRSAYLRGADLRDANLEGANLEGANLEGANLQRAGLYRTNLQRADLRDADLRGAHLQKADLRGANLRGAKLDSVGLAIAKASGAIGLDPAGSEVAKAVPEKPKPAKRIASEKQTEKEAADRSSIEAKKIQTALRELDFYSGKIDGLLGKMSQKAIKEWQKQNNFYADGILTSDQEAQLTENIEVSSSGSDLTQNDGDHVVDSTGLSWGPLALPLAFIVIGYLVYSYGKGSFGEEDGRFGTGYKDNVIPRVGIGCLCLIIGGFIVIIGIVGCFQNIQSLPP